MKEMFTRHLGKLIENTKNPLTHPSAEQATQDKETAANSLQGELATPQRVGERPTLLAVEKSKKRRIPFVALALMVVLTSLCVISVVGWPITWTASADSSLTTLHRSSSLHLDTPVTDGPLGITGLPTTDQYPYTTDCQEEFQSYGTYDNSGNPNAYNKVCWNIGDFQWGNADITCIVNTRLQQEIDAFNRQTGLNFGQNTLSSATPGSTGALEGYNQNSCVDGHTCYSDNTSGEDTSTPGVISIHNQVWGDDIICSNNACTGTTSPGNTPSSGNTDNIANPCGAGGAAYDKFACRPVQSGQTGNDAYYYNPTAYNPYGAVEVPKEGIGGHFNGQTINHTQDTPSCTVSGFWSCQSSDRVNIVMGTDQGIVGPLSDLDSMINPFTAASPLQISGNNSPDPVLSLPIQFPPRYLVLCNDLNQGWAFPCSDQNSSSAMPGQNTNVTTSLDNGQVNEGTVKDDWLSGDFQDPEPSTADPRRPPSGNLEHTYLINTIQQPGVQKLEGITLGIGFALITPVLIMIGYQLLWASWTLGHANAMEALGRMVLSIVAIGASYQLAAMLIQLVNEFNMAIVAFHAQLGYPKITLGNTVSTFYSKGEETVPQSFRGIVVPISRWGCIANDFVAILATKFWTDMEQFIPFVGGFVHFILSVVNIIDVAHHIGEFIILIMTISLCTQVFLRLVLLNYYILMAPVAFGCWGLPTGVGQKVVSSWAKGFLSLLFSQTVQLFVLTTFPLILPNFPNFPSDRFAILNTVFDVLPRMLVIVATLKVPTVMGTKATQALAQAGTVVGGAVAAGAAAAYHAV